MNKTTAIPYLKAVFDAAPFAKLECIVDRKRVGIQRVLFATRYTNL